MRHVALCVVEVVNDNFYLRPEARRIFVACVVGGAAWMLGLAVSASSSAVRFIWVRCGTVLIYTTWICVFCYLETLWVLKRIDEDKYDAMRQPTDSPLFAALSLGEILRVQEGFEALMRFLVKEWSC